MIRKSLYIGLPILVAIVLVAVFAGSIREWCEPNDKRLGQLTWGQGKLHAPSLWDCARMGE